MNQQQDIFKAIEKHIYEHVKATIKGESEPRTVLITRDLVRG